MSKQFKFKIIHVLVILFSIIMVAIGYGIAADDPRNSCAVGVPTAISTFALACLFESKLETVLFIINKKGDLL